MKFISDLLTQLLFAYTILVEPFVRTHFYRLLKKQVNSNPGARLLYYRTQVLWEWCWVVVLVLIVLPAPDRLAVLGLTLPNPLGWIILAALLLGIGLSIVLLKRNPGALERMRQSLAANSFLLPATGVERNWYAAAAITAGICEELLFRGFLILTLHFTFPSLDLVVISIISGLVYGLSRAYQGWKGILQTALTGFGYAVVFILGGSLIPVIVVHALAELRNLVAWQPEAVGNPAR